MNRPGVAKRSQWMKSGLRTTDPSGPPQGFTGFDSWSVGRTSEIATSYLRAVRLFNRDVRLFLIAVALIRFAAFGSIYTVLLNLYLLRLGYGPEFVGLVNAVGMFASAAFSLPASALGRRWSSRRIMIAGLSLSVVGFGALPLNEFTPLTWRVGWILVAYFLAWLGSTLYIVNPP